MKDVVITHGVRTPIAKIGASLHTIGEDDLAAMVVEELLYSRAKLKQKDEVDHVIFGNVKQSSNPSNIARVAALKAGLPQTVPAYTVHRQCGSGLQAIMDAYQMILCDQAELIVAGGAESMSRSVYFMRNSRSGLGIGNYSVEDSLTAGGPGAIPAQKYGNRPMGITAENLAEMYKISRYAQDRFAHSSQEKAAKAIAEGRFNEQIMPIKTPNGTTFNADEHPNLSSIEKLAALKPAFIKDGTVTAGNSSGRNDGAAAVLVMSAQKAALLGYSPIIRIRSIAASGCDPVIMGISPVECTRIALKRAELTINDIDVIELNEAFAAQAIAVSEEWEKWGITRRALNEKLNPNGGAIALGHPLGCTGAALTVKCMYELLRIPTHKYGLITLCCAGGVGAAVIIEKTECTS